MPSSLPIKLAASAVLSSLIAIGCTLTTGGDGDDNFGAAGSDSAGGSGGKNTGGSSSGGKSTGGTVASGGAATGGGPAGGATASGGTGSAVMCNDAGTAMPTMVIKTCQADSPTMTCQACIAAKCCTEYERCNGDSPRTPCGYGGLDGTGEAKCIQACVRKSDLTDDKGFMDCADMCKTNSPMCQVTDPATDKLINCMKGDLMATPPVSGCLAECFQ